MYKKLVMGIILSMLLCIGSAFAGTAVVDYTDAGNAGYGYFDVVVTGDGSATNIDFASCVDSAGVTQNYTNKLLGYYVYVVKTIPGTGDATPAAYTIDIKDADGHIFLPIPARSTTDAEWYAGHLTEASQYEIILSKITLTVSASILAADTTHIRLVLGKWRD